MKERLKKKLKNNSGETIGEVLVALLISGLALLMLAGAITTSSDLVTRSSRKQEEYYAKNEALLTDTGGTSGRQLTMILRGVGISNQKYENINYNINDEIGNIPIVAYTKKE